MDALGVSAILILIAFLGATIFVVRWAGVFAVRRMNSARLNRLKHQLEHPDEEASAERTEADNIALTALVHHCEDLRSRWLLREEDLRFAERALELVRRIAGAYHPESTQPENQARLGRLLEACLEFKNDLMSLMRISGVKRAGQFRLRHIVFITRAWEKKRQWEQKAGINKVRESPLYLPLKWTYWLWRCVDVSFWVAKSATYFTYDVAFKVFLVHGYLLLGERAIAVYREQALPREPEADGLLEEMASMSTEETLAENALPERIQEIAKSSRERILYDPWRVELDTVKTVYRELVDEIAWYHHPESAEPQYEVRIYDLMMSLARLAETLYGMKSKPVLNKLLDFRLSHVWMVRDSANYFQDSQVMEWIRKYRLTQIVKYSGLLYRVILKRHPGILFKDFALTLASEGAKRWAYLYCHDRLAEEAHWTYKPRKLKE